MSRPTVSCICPTYNRQIFLPKLLKIYQSQTYPHNLMDLIILDDSTETCQSIIDNFLEQYPECNVKYTYSNVKIPLGKKRNILNSMATGEYIICFDDDDFYPPERVAHTITRLHSTKKLIAGSSKLHVYFSHLD